MEIKIRYTCVKEKATFSRVFTIEEIENGSCKRWMDINVVGAGRLYKDLWTGLQDKNGVDIYENDVIERRGMKNTWVEFDRGEFVLRYDTEKAEYRRSLKTEFHLHIEIIGNKHTTPELLKK